MNSPLDALKRELERFGEANDASQTERARRMLNITRDTGEFLSVLVRAMGAQRILEIGTSNAYSTLWFAEAARATGGHVTTIEFAACKVELARTTLARSGLGDLVSIVQEDAGAVLRSAADAACDFIFLDADRGAYPGWWPDLRRALRPGGLLVADNAVSHRGEIAAFIALVEEDAAFATSLVPVGNGEFLAVKSAQ